MPRGVYSPYRVRSKEIMTIENVLEDVKKFFMLVGYFTCFWIVCRLYILWQMRNMYRDDPPAQMPDGFPRGRDDENLSDKKYEEDA